MITGMKERIDRAFEAKNINAEEAGFLRKALRDIMQGASQAHSMKQKGTCSIKRRGATQLYFREEDLKAFEQVLLDIESGDRHSLSAMLICSTCPDYIGEPPEADFFTIEDLNLMKDGCIKFVKVNGSFRFIDAMSDLRHVDIVFKGEEAQAAGVLFLFKDYWRMESTYSETLKVQCGQTEVDELKKLITRGCVDKR